MSDSDKYPADSGRRRFVKGVVGGAALAGVGTTGAAAVNSATSSTGSGGGPTQASLSRTPPDRHHGECRSSRSR